MYLDYPRLLGELMICNSPIFDKELFRSMWKPVTSAIAFALMTFDDNYIIERATTGFRQCATLAGHFQLPEVVDYVVVSLSKATGLLSDNLPSEVPLYPVVEVEGRSITVSSLAVNFGAHVKGQLAFGVLFDIVKCNGNAIREGWTQVRRFVLQLFQVLDVFACRSLEFFSTCSFIPCSPPEWFRWRISWVVFL